MVGAAATAVDAAVDDPAPDLPASKAAAAATPPAATAIAIHLRGLREAVGVPGAAGADRDVETLPLLGSAMYWDETAPARACSLAATMRIWKGPGA